MHVKLDMRERRMRDGGVPSLFPLSSRRATVITYYTRSPSENVKKVLYSAIYGLCCFLYIETLMRALIIASFYRACKVGYM